MRFDIITLFPEMCSAVMGESIIGRAQKAGKIEVHCHQLRDYSTDKHRRVDDSPYGGGMGMVMQCEPIYRCFLDICDTIGTKPHTIYMSPKGKLFRQSTAVRLAGYDNICVLCGHYEGVDERIIEKIVDEEISIGDYVLTGGELPALVMCDAIARMCPGVLSAEECYTEESHFSGLLEYPQYTRPEVWEGMAVPDVLLTGDHRRIEKFRHRQSVEITMKRRPDMIEALENSY